MRNRLFIKENNKSTASKMLTEKGDVITIGKEADKIKLTPHGAAYYNAVWKDVPELSNVVPKNLSNEVLKVISTPTDKDFCFITTSIQNHVHVAVDGGDGYYYSPGYLTGKTSSHYLSEETFVTFQQRQQGNANPKANDKKQRIYESENFVRIPKNEATVMKYGTEYFHEIKKKGYFDNRIQELSKKPFVEYSAVGITKEKAIDMCIEHDRRVTQGIQQPKTKEQIELEKLSKEKIEASNLSKKMQLQEKVTKDNDNDNDK